MSMRIFFTIDTVFNNYLKTHFEKEKEPVLIRYYSNFITSFKLETTLFCTIPLMYLSLLFWNSYTDLFTCKALIIISIISLLTMIYLRYEIKQATHTANALRKLINECFETKENKQ